MMTPARKTLEVLVRGLPILAIFGVFWLPLIVHYHTPAPEIGEGVIQTLRDKPSDAAYAELVDLEFGALKLHHYTDQEIVTAAEGLFERQFKLPGWELRAVGVPFDARDVPEGPGSWQLRYASLVLPAILTEAFERTNNDRYLIAARDFLIDWNAYESSLWIPSGFVWNDHAAAARVVTLSRFWRHYRRHAAFDGASARQILSVAVRTGHLLARPDHYTFATNHGTFQSLGLFHLSLSFPALAQFSDYAELARERLAEQMEYLVAPDGTVLEHSAEYHASGLDRMSMTFRYMTLAGFEIPDDWRRKYSKAQEFHAALIRPDGTLPRLGTTKPRVAAHGVSISDFDESGGASQPRLQAIEPLSGSYRLLPTSGYAAWWTGPAGSDPAAQLVVAWSNFEGHAHKSADELSLYAWAGGVEWLTASGYWPAGAPPGTGWASSWPASNAPHLVGEPPRGKRSLHLLGSWSSPSLSGVDIKRSNPDGFDVRRQIVSTGGHAWIVIDSFQDTHDRRALTAWTLDPSVEAEPGGEPHAFTFRAGNSPVRVRAWFLGDQQRTLDLHRGSTNPAAGWAIGTDNRPQPAYAIHVEQPSRGSWSAAAFLASPAQEPASERSSADMERWTSPTDWSVLITEGPRQVRVSRSEARIEATDSASSEPPAAAEMQEPPDVDAEGRHIRSSFAAAADRYGAKFSPALEFRKKLTLLLVALFVLQELVLLLLGRFTRVPLLPLRVGAAGLWILGLTAIYARYLA